MSVENQYRRNKMIELEWIVNEMTGEKHLYYRELPGKPAEIHWQRVPTKTLEESYYDDLRESGGLFPHD